VGPGEGAGSGAAGAGPGAGSFGQIAHVLSDFDVPPATT
jgi:hypothetical protein